ncbi:MAG TPA: DUF2845 domain-containing protein [Pseudomonas sp.]|uniref:DUF2845 domain-containing protein n=1 Tax=Pseudomonas sp. TaxID=306 RepID=UPI002ED87C7A
MNFNKASMLIVVPLLMWTCAVSATMRCGTSLIAEGDGMDAVREKCGAPDRQTSEGPALRSNGVPRLNAAKISIWVYGPHNGAYQYLRFIDDKLTSMETKRE